MYKKILSSITSLLIVTSTAAGTGNFGTGMQYSKAPMTAFAKTDFDGNEYTEGTYENLTYSKYTDHVAVTSCDKLVKGEVIIPAEIEELPVTEISEFAFNKCENLTKVTIPDSVTFISINAFANCTKLSEIAIPESVTEIGYDAFANTKWLESKRAENPIVTVNNMIVDGKTCNGDVVIPEGITSICEYAFSFCNELTSITMPDTVTDLHNDAFYECRNLTKIKLSESITSIKRYAFGFCSSLTEINIPESVTSIGRYAFEGCSSLKKVTVPESVSLIDQYAFHLCRELEEITILDPDCEIYDHSSTISNEITTDLGGAYNGVIRGYENSTVQAFAEKYGYKFEALAEIADEGTYKSLTYKKYSDHVVISECDESAEGVIEIPDEIEGLPVTEIDAFAFEGCSQLEEITLPESVEKIGERAFFCCERLNKITILNPDCKIYESPETILTGYDNVDEEDGTAWVHYYYNGVICGYRGSTAQVYAEKFLYTFKSVYTEGTYESLTYDKHSDHIVITGCDNSAVSVSVPSEIEGLPVTEIGYKAFYNCWKMTDIVLPDSITVIGDSAFERCEKLNEITLPDSVTKIGKSAFELCEKLEKINIPDGVTSIEDSAFRWCESLKEISLPDGVRSIGSSAFSSCTNLAKITVPDSVLEIGSHAFMKCESLTEIHIPNSLDTIEALTFGYCSSLTEITIPDSVTLIGNIAFRCCNNLTEVTVPESVKTINEGAFAECEKLKVITILNPDCEISPRPDTITNGEEEDNGAFYDYYYGVIRGYENSTAQAYAQRYKRTFESLGEAPAEEILYGDANCDGVVSIADATAILQYLGNRDKYDLTKQGKKNADCYKTGDGVTPLDAIAIQRLDAGLIEKLPE